MLTHTHTKKKKQLQQDSIVIQQQQQKMRKKHAIHVSFSFWVFDSDLYLVPFLFFFNSRTALQVLWEKEKVSVLFIQLLFWRFHCLTFGFWLPQKRGEKKIRRACGVTLVLSFRYEIRPQHTTYKHSLSLYSSFFFFYFWRGLLFFFFQYLNEESRVLCNFLFSI